MLSNEVNSRISSLGVFDPQGFEQVLKIAETLMRSDLVPSIYQAGLDSTKNNKARANVLIALNMANRMQADPLMVMQNLYIVHNRPSWSSQFLIACFNSCGRFSALQYKFSGEPGTDDYGCFAWAVEHSTGQKIEGTKITLKMANQEGWIKNPKWKNMPEQMLRYRAATFFIRTTAPELAMGLTTQEEAEDMRDVTPQEDSPVETSKKTYANTRVKGVKPAEPVIEAEATEPVVEPKVEAPKAEPVEKSPKSSSWEEAMTRRTPTEIDRETGEIKNYTAPKKSLQELQEEARKMSEQGEEA